MQKTITRLETLKHVSNVENVEKFVNVNAKGKTDSEIIDKNSKVIFNIVKFIKENKKCDTKGVRGVGTGGVPGVGTNDIPDVKTIKSILIDFLYKEDDMYETYDFICKIYPFETDIVKQPVGGGIRKDFKCPTSFTFTSKPSPDVCKNFINVIIMNLMI